MDALRLKKVQGPAERKRKKTNKEWEVNSDPRKLSPTVNTFLISLATVMQNDNMRKIIDLLGRLENHLSAPLSQLTPGDSGMNVAQRCKALGDQNPAKQCFILEGDLIEISLHFMIAQIQLVLWIHR
jgi:hypothetical protein